MLGDWAKMAAGLAAAAAAGLAMGLMMVSGFAVVVAVAGSPVAGLAPSSVVVG